MVERQRRPGLPLLSKTAGADGELAFGLQELRHKTCAYSLIPDILFDYHLPSRPAFPAEGSTRVPQCKTKSTYQPLDLRFQNAH
jgi:hypothetical protein